MLTVSPEAAQEAVLNVCLLNTSRPWLVLEGLEGLEGLEEGKLMARMEVMEVERNNRTLALIVLDCSAPQTASQL